MSIGRKVVLYEQVFYLQQIQLSLQGLLNTSPLLCDDFEISCYLSIGRFLIPINFFYINFNKLLINNRKVKRYKEEGIERDNILYIGLSLYRGKVVFALSIVSVACVYPIHMGIICLQEDSISFFFIESYISIEGFGYKFCIRWVFCVSFGKDCYIVYRRNSLYRG